MAGFVERNEGERRAITAMWCFLAGQPKKTRQLDDWNTDEPP
jgi:hypothetical protein